jgi:hypothetical protein
MLLQNVGNHLQGITTQKTTINILNHTLNVVRIKIIYMSCCLNKNTQHYVWLKSHCPVLVIQGFECSLNLDVKRSKAFKFYTL